MAQQPGNEEIPPADEEGETKSDKESGEVVLEKEAKKEQD